MITLPDSRDVRPSSVMGTDRLWAQINLDVNGLCPRSHPPEQTWENLMSAGNQHTVDGLEPAWAVSGRHWRSNGPFANLAIKLLMGVGAEYQTSLTDGRRVRNRRVANYVTFIPKSESSRSMSYRFVKVTFYTSFMQLSCISRHVNFYELIEYCLLTYKNTTQFSAIHFLVPIVEWNWRSVYWLMLKFAIGNNEFSVKSRIFLE